MAIWKVCFGFLRAYPFITPVNCARVPFRPGAWNSLRLENPAYASILEHSNTRSTNFLAAIGYWQFSGQSVAENEGGGFGARTSKPLARQFTVSTWTCHFHSGTERWTSKPRDKDSFDDQKQIEQPLHGGTSASTQYHYAECG